MAQEAVAPVLDHAQHAYTLAGKPLVSVSKVIYALVKKSFDGVDPAVLANAAERGMRVEEYATELLKTGSVTTRPNEREDVLQRMECFERWWLNAKPELIDAQRLVWSEEDGVAGTLDFILRVNGRVVICDLKCTSQPESTWALQLGAYYWMEPTEVESCAVLHINPKYKQGYIWREYSPVAVGEQWKAALAWYRVLQSLKAEAAE